VTRAPAVPPAAVLAREPSLSLFSTDPNPDSRTCAAHLDVKLDVHHGELLVVVVPLTEEAAAEAAAELERLAWR
jgi:hypothetical protein